MTATTSPSPCEEHGVQATKPPWRFARERRLGKRARALVGIAEAENSRCLIVLGAEPVLQATREDSWALACLRRAADCADATEEEAWVLLAACRPTPVRRAIFGQRLPRAHAARPKTLPAASPNTGADQPAVGWRAQLAEIGKQLSSESS
jgi:hypothetical protein